MKSACAAEIVGVHPKMLSHPPVNSIVYSPGPIAVFVILYAGEESVSNAPGPEVWISDSALVSSLYLECSVTQPAARDHFALQSGPACQVIGFGGSATDACCSAVMQPHRTSAAAAAIDTRRNMTPSFSYTIYYDTESQISRRYVPPKRTRSRSLRPNPLDRDRAGPPVS